MPRTVLPSQLTRNLKFLYGSKRCGFLVKPVAIAPHPSTLEIAGDLLNLDDDELGGLERSEADLDVDDAEVAVVLRRRLAVALDVESLVRRAALERPLAEEVHHEGVEVEPDLGPQRLVVRLEDDPLRAAEQRLFEEEREAADG